MANYGKIFPASVVGRVYQFVPPYQAFPPLWCRLKTDGGSTGTVAAQWRNLDIISQEKVRVSTSSIIDRYRFIHPTNTSLRIDYETRYETKYPVFPSTSAISYWRTWYAYDASGLVASNGEEQWPANGAFPNGLDNTITEIWSNRPNLSKWNLFKAEMSAALWTDVPDFHPYRH